MREWPAGSWKGHLGRKEELRAGVDCIALAAGAGPERWERFGFPQWGQIPEENVAQGIPSADPQREQKRWLIHRGSDQKWM